MKTGKFIVFLIILVLFPCFSIFAQYEFMLKDDSNFYVFYEPPSWWNSWEKYKSEVARYYFKENNRIEHLTWDNNNSILKRGVYNIDDSKNVPFLDIHWDDNTTERYLLLANEYFMCLYNGDFEPFFFGFRYSYAHYGTGMSEEFLWKEERSLYDYRVSATNSLIEGGINYSPTSERLGLQINKVWAVKGGAGESLFINASSSLGERDNYLYISIGYVAYSKPNLYSENSRPKKIRISNTRNGEFREFELEDTPNFQEINITGLGLDVVKWEWNWEMSMQLEILEIYPGTKYNDTCVNSILFFGRFK